jgi:acyl-CoA thioester hydrolase
LGGTCYPVAAKTVKNRGALKFIERARSEWVRGLGVDQSALRAQGVVFAVRRVVADYVRPAVFDDELQVRTQVLAATGARLTLAQTVWRGDALLFEAEVQLVCLSDAGRAVRFPAVVLAAVTVM